MPLPQLPDWVFLSKEDRILAKEAEKKDATLIAEEEWNHCDVPRAAEEDPTCRRFIPTLSSWDRYLFGGAHKWRIMMVKNRIRIYLGLSPLQEMNSLLLLCCLYCWVARWRSADRLGKAWDKESPRFGPSERN